tara:strand:- start:131754 stop:132014 length:261 start_codon:yes stop_codon:yes gene_type:complete
MSHEDLAKALQTVQQELDQADHLDASDVEKLKRTIDEIETTIAAKSEHAVTLSERISESAKEFEASHPVLTMNLGRIADILQRMGF